MTATRDKLWTVEAYHRMIDAGILTEDDKVELLNGRIVQMSAQTPPHAGTNGSPVLRVINLSNHS